MSSAVPPRKLPLMKLALVAGVLLIGALLLLRGVDLHALANRGMDLIRAAGPWAFFAAMAILPAFGVPLLGFTVPAGEAFGAQLGLPVVIALSLAMIAVNLAFGYWLAR